MRKLLLAGVSLFAFGIASASAADLPRREAAPIPFMPPPYNWSGFYLGINGGGGFGNSDFSGPFDGSYNLSGGLVGGTAGYNWQFGQWVLGLEGDMDWSNIRGSATCGGGITTCETRNDWLGTVRGRVGYAFDRFLPYVTGGLAVGGVKTSVAGFGDSSDTRAGWTVGAGIEAAIAGPWTAKVEYLYVDLGNTGSVIGSDASFHTNIVRAGLNYRF